MRAIRIVLPALITSSVLLASLAWAGVTTRVSVSRERAEANDSSSGVSAISADGRYVAFDSYASNLVSGDTNGISDVFVCDRQTGVVERISVATDGTQGNGQSYNWSISADGRYVAFYSYATNLSPGDDNGTSDVFVHDRQTGVTERISISTDSFGADDRSFDPVTSADGRYVVFYSSATNLVPDDTNAVSDVFMRDRQTGTTTRLSMAFDGTQANSHSYDACMSSDGRYVAFDSYAYNLVPDDTNGKRDVFLLDRQTGVTELLSVADTGMQGNKPSYYARMSADARYVAFNSSATNLVSGDTNNCDDIFVRDRQTGLTERVSIGTGGVQGNGATGYFTSMSADGRYVAFHSAATNLVPHDTNTALDVFVRDRQSGVTERISVASDRAQGDLASDYASISANGRYVAFRSKATNLVPGDTNAKPDVLVHDRWSIADTKDLPDGAQAVLSAGSVSASLDGCFYSEDADRSSGIKILWNGAVVPGDRYRADGTMATDANGERYINASSVLRIDTLPVAPVGLIGRSLGGMNKAYDPLTGAGQQGIPGAYGLNNIGLLVRIFGRVTQLGDNCLYLNDGSDMRDGTHTGAEENIGVRVIGSPTGYNIGDKLEVTGISSCFVTPSGSLARCILIGSPLDIRKLNLP